MKSQVLPADAANAMDAALGVLRAGGLVAFPTDTVYGIGALAFDEKAVQSIYEAKGRSDEKAIPVLLAGTAELDQVSHSLPRMARLLAEQFWPGPLTLVVPKVSRLPSAVSASDTVGVRVPDHPVALALLKRSGPLAVTSANLSGQPSPCTAQDVLQQLDGRVPLILDAGRTPGGIPSTVLDCTRAEPHILRAGPITLEEIRAVLHRH